MGSSQEEEGPPPNPIIIIITVITVALDQREVSPHRLQARDLRKNISSIGKKEGRSSVSKHLPGHSAKYYSDTED